jgi:hypothetical protein
MIRLLVTISVLFVLALAASAEPRATTSGTWTCSTKETAPDRLQFSLRTDQDGNMGMGFDRSDFAGLTAEQVGSDTRVPVRFEMRREAGTILFEGTFREGRGAGEYTFAPNPDYRSMLDRLGVELGAKRGAEAREMLSLTLFDVSTSFIRSMQKIGYKEPLQQYVTFRIFKVDPEYVATMSAVGFRDLSAEKLVETRIHNVSPEYIQRMRAAGNDLTLDQYIQSRIFEVTPEFAEEMSRIGYPDLDQETLVQFRIHGVSAEFVRTLRQLGYSNVAPQQLVAMRIHGVTPEFIRRVAAAGYHGVPIEKLVQMRIFDIDPEMVGALDDDRR